LNSWKVDKATLILKGFIKPGCFSGLFCWNYISGIFGLADLFYAFDKQKHFISRYDYMGFGETLLPAGVAA